MGDVLDAGVVHRTAVRLLVLDEAGSILLIHYLMPDTGEDVWCTPGGALDAGETHEQAAVRELREEVGWRGEVGLGAPVWSREHVFRIGDGRVFRQHEQYHVLWLPHFDARATSPSEFEARAITGMRWWNLAELMTTDETLQPQQLPALLQRVLEARGGRS